MSVFFFTVDSYLIEITYESYPWLAVRREKKAAVQGEPRVLFKVATPRS